MAFAFGKLVLLLLRPSNLLLLLGLVGLLRPRPRPAGVKSLPALALGLMLLVTLLPVGDWLMAPLEDRFPRPAAYPARVDGVVVLGGGVLPEITAARGAPAFSEAGERYLALLELARRYPDARIVFTGGVGTLGGGAPPETDAVALLLRQHGLPDGRVALDDRARSTRENALNAKALARPGPGELWLLVTSAGHVPRAMGCFRAVGWEPTPWPVDYRTTGPFELALGLRVADRLRELDEAVHEWFGLAYYRLLGWTPALFPGP